MTVRDLVILGTSSQHPTRFRNHGGYLFRWRNEGMLFDPGEGMQRQFIFAEVSPTVITRIFISHFHGDHCLGLGSMLLRLNLDKVTHKIKCYYPASGKIYFNRLKLGTIAKMNLNIEEIPVRKGGIVDDEGDFIVTAEFLKHGVDCIGWRVEEKKVRKFDGKKLKECGLNGLEIKNLIENGSVESKTKTINLNDVSKVIQGDAIAVVLDTNYCNNAIKISKDASLLLCESTYLKTETELAKKHYHLTATMSAQIAKEAKVKSLVLTHFSARYVNEQKFKKEAEKIFPNVIAAKDIMKIDIPKSR